LLWVAAVVVTLVSVVYQRSVGPTRPVRGSAELDGHRIRFVLPRSYGGETDCPITVAAPDSSFHGWLLHRLYRAGDAWSRDAMRWEDGRLAGAIPREAPGVKVAYRLFLSPPPKTSEGPEPSISSRLVGVPPGGEVLLRFRGAVPPWILAPHVLLMFLGMLWSARAGIEALGGRGDPLRYARWTLLLLVLGGLAFGPAVQWYSFGKAWTGFPVGMDLTDNKTLIAVLFWIAAVAAGVMTRRRAAGHGSGISARPVRALVLLAAVVTLVIFAIPHSVMGTETRPSAAESRTGTEAAP
jgi:hypothetical protein